ncbi:MAG: 2,3-bisphosphoglycerate-independent phosphoglycerate mutase, partial [Thermodesulfobacteriota bacterium]
MKTERPCLLMILDGWGVNPATDGNAISLAETPNLNRLQAEYPHTRLVCSGEAVGLPEGIMGNSEVGHLNIGAGRVVYQDLLRIDLAVQNGDIFENPAMSELMEKVNRQGGRLHLMGLVSDGGVHSQLTHLLALLDMARQKGVNQVLVHAILDGRDTSPTAGIDYLRQVTDHMERHRFGEIATICGRYYAMDRDKRWDRIEKAFRLFTEGDGVTESDPIQAVAHAYERGETDEFVKPIVITPEGKKTVVVSNGDGVIFFNFRADRAR